MPKRLKIKTPITDGKNSTYNLNLPDSTNWSNDKVIATEDFVRTNSSSASSLPISVDTTIASIKAILGLDSFMTWDEQTGWVNNRSALLRGEYDYLDTDGYICNSEFNTLSDTLNILYNGLGGRMLLVGISKGAGSRFYLYRIGGFGHASITSISKAVNPGDLICIKEPNIPDRWCQDTSTFKVIEAKPSFIETTWAELKALRDNSKLVPGCFYRITDYVTKVSTDKSGTYTQYTLDIDSAEKPFDIIVLAATTNSLCPEAKAAIHADGYSFAGIADWELRYSLDNNYSSYAWADNTNGKGVIYYMKDQRGNEAPYDFKNIREKITLGQKFMFFTPQPYGEMHGQYSRQTDRDVEIGGIQYYCYKLPPNPATSYGYFTVEEPITGSIVYKNTNDSMVSMSTVKIADMTEPKYFYLFSTISASGSISDASSAGRSFSGPSCNSITFTNNTIDIPAIHFIDITISSHCDNKIICGDETRQYRDLYNNILSGECSHCLIDHSYNLKYKPGTTHISEYVSFKHSSNIQGNLYYVNNTSFEGCHNLIFGQSSATIKKIPNNSEFFSCGYTSFTPSTPAAYSVYLDITGANENIHAYNIKHIRSGNNTMTISETADLIYVYPSTVANVYRR